MSRMSRWMLGGILAIAIAHIAAFVLWFGPNALNGYSDFAILYTAGKIVDNGDAAHLYDPATQWKVQQQCCDVPIRQGPLLFNHGPYEALIFAPLALLSYPAAFLLWTVLNLGALLLISYLLRKYLSALLPHWLLFPLIAIAWFPCFITLVQGQDSFLLTLIYIAAFLALKNGSPVLAGTVLAAGMYKPQLVLPFIAILALRREWKAIGGFLFGFAGSATASIALIGWPATLGYAQFLFRFARMPIQESAAPAFNMPNIRGLVLTLLGANGTSRTGLALVVGLSVAALWFASRCWRQNLELGFSLGICAMLLASYHLFWYDVTVLLMPAVILASQIRSSVAKLILKVSVGAWIVSPLIFEVVAHRLGCLLAILLLGFGLALWVEHRHGVRGAMQVAAVAS